MDLYTTPTNSQGRFVILLLAKLGIFIFMTSLILITFRSLYSPHPIIEGDGVAYVKPTSSRVNVFVEVRHLSVIRPEGVYTSRILRPESTTNHSKDIHIEGGDIYAEEGTFSIIHTILLPPFIKGRWCSYIYYSWWPSFSQMEFSFEGKPICFEIPEIKDEE